MWPPARQSNLTAWQLPRQEADITVPSMSKFPDQKSLICLVTVIIKMLTLKKDCIFKVCSMEKKIEKYL